MSDLQAVCLTVAVCLGMFLCFVGWLAYLGLKDDEKKVIGCTNNCNQGRNCTCCPK